MRSAVSELWAVVLVGIALAWSFVELLTPRMQGPAWSEVHAPVARKITEELFSKLTACVRNLDNLAG
jgi:hypothetical protein